MLTFREEIISESKLRSQRGAISTFILLVILAFLLTACGDNGNNAETANSTETTSGFPSMITVSESNSAISIPFLTTALGNADAPLGKVDIINDTGSIEISSVVTSSILYIKISEYYGYRVYQGFAVGPSSWDIFWLYCQGSNIAYIYDEGIGSRSLFYVPASGSCTETSTNANVTASLPALSMASPTPIGGPTVLGDAIAIQSDGTGSLKVGDKSMPLIVFSQVDCWTCGSPGWYELHSIVWDDSLTQAIFVIIYLIENDKNTIELAYARSLPNFSDPIGNQVLLAAWTVPSLSLGARVTFPSRIGVPPPSLVHQ